MRTTLITTGGTIAWHEGLGRMLKPSELLAAAGETVDELVELEPVPSWDLSVADMAEIARKVRQAIELGSDSVVVTHGTDTMEETVWLTELTLGSRLRARASVVFTGAMRFADDPDPDGPRNLQWALQSSRESRTGGHGARVAWHGQLHAARWVRKVDAASADPFDSGGRPDFAPSPPEPGGNLNLTVVLLKVGPLARPPLPSGAAGIVLEGTGAAHVPSSYSARIEELVAGGVPVVLATRSQDVVRSSSIGDGVLYAADLTAEKAAIALMVGLGRHRELGELRRWWADLLAQGPGRGQPESQRH